MTTLVRTQMTVLSDRTIRNYINDNRIGIFPIPADRAFQPASVDLRLASTFLNLDGSERHPIQYEGDSLECDIKPGEFYLGSTVEHIKIPDNLVARVEGKSSLGRMGILVHATAGFIDPGFEGNITLEFANLSDRTFYFEPGMYICQVSFEALNIPAERPYGHPELKSNYQGQDGVKASRYA